MLKAISDTTISFRTYVIVMVQAFYKHKLFFTIAESILWYIPYYWMTKVCPSLAATIINKGFCKGLILPE